MCKAPLLLLVLVLTLLGCAADPDRGAPGPGAWSKAVNGLQARLRFARKEVVNGTPVITAYLELRNVSTNSNVMELPVDGEGVQYRFKVSTANGDSVPPVSPPYDEARVEVGVVRLPFDSLLRLNITHRGAGVPKDYAASLDLGPLAVWYFKPGEQTYYLQAEFTVKKTGAARWSGTLVIPRAALPVDKD